jgi:hypothetical protein
VVHVRGSYDWNFVRETWEEKAALHAVQMWVNGEVVWKRSASVLIAASLNESYFVETVTLFGSLTEILMVDLVIGDGESTDLDGFQVVI